MKDKDIERLLRSLPRQKASPEFTTRLLRKVRERKETPSRETRWLAPRPLLAGVTALLLLGAATTGLQRWYELLERSQAARRVEALRSEYEALEKELEELRSLAATSQPVVELGSTENMDILLDLRTLSRLTPATGRDSQAQSVEYRR